MIVKGKVDFVQDNWRKRGEYPTQNEWVGITCFRVYGPYETDLGIEACEVREALTDYDFIGNERSGDTLLNFGTTKVYTRSICGGQPSDY